MSIFQSASSHGRLAGGPSRHQVQVLASHSAIVWHVIPVSSSYSSQDEDLEGSEANGIGCACVLFSLQRSPRLVSHTIAAGRRGDLRGVLR